MDAVGNLLAERERESIPWGAGISLALILHVGIAAGFVISTFGQRGPLVSPRAVSVRILPAGSLRGGTVRRAAALEPEKRRILKPPDEDEPPPPSEKAVLLPAPEEKKTSPRPASETAEPKAKGPDLALPGSGDTEGAGAGGPVGASGSSGVGGTRLDQADFTYSYYVDRMLIAIGTNWFKPSQAGSASPVIYFRIERDGAIADPVVEKSSGLPFVDRAALRAVIASSPLPPLPAEYGGTHLGVHLKFE